MIKNVIEAGTDLLIERMVELSVAISEFESYIVPALSLVKVYSISPQSISVGTLKN